VATWAALCPYFEYYNFCRLYDVIRVTPAIEARITGHIIVNLYRSYHVHVSCVVQSKSTHSVEISLLFFFC
jgi:hypothetical protein